jgi:hypothetical protein
MAMEAKSETNVPGEISAQEAVSPQASEEVIRQQIHRQRRRRSRSARERSKRNKRMRFILIMAGQAFFLLLLIYVWFKVSSAVQ